MSAVNEGSVGTALAWSKAPSCNGRGPERAKLTFRSLGPFYLDTVRCKHPWGSSRHPGLGSAMSFLGQWGRPLELVPEEVGGTFKSM